MLGAISSLALCLCHPASREDLLAFAENTYLGHVAPVDMDIALNAQDDPSPVEENVFDEPPPPVTDKAYLPASLKLKVSGGDTLLTMLTDTGLDYEEAYDAVKAIRSVYDPKKLDVGQPIAVSLNASDDKPGMPVLSALSFPISQTASVQLTRKDSGDFAVKKIEAPMVKKLVRASGSITSSLYETGISLGISPANLAELIKVYSYDVDFQRDIKRGHTLEAVFERMQTADGKGVGASTLLYASLNLGDRTIPMYRFTDSSGVTDYYNARGESLRKALLRTPINGVKITSGFGMRMHPLLGYSKMHRGVDFGAATGTPIYAAGDGVVEMAGANGSYGNYVRIRHNDKYETAYAHTSRIASGIKVGSKVRQGQVIAYVGTTGRSTGPHLHYEVLMSGNQINPAGIKFKTGNMLMGRELASFRKNAGQVQAMLNEKAKSKLAMAEDSPSGHTRKN